MDEYDWLLSQLKKASILSGGLLRKKMGEIVEQFVEIVWNNVSKDYPTLEAKIVKGESAPIPIYGSFSESVDRHCFINGKLVLAIECKTYLDKCYLQRADSDFSLLKEKEDFTSIIVSLQDSISKDAFSYFLNKRNVEHVFFFSNEKRSSTPNKHISRNPDWISRNKINIFIDFVKTIFETEAYKNGTY